MIKLCALLLLAATAAPAQEPAAQEMRAVLVEGPVTLASGAAVAQDAVLHAGDTVQTGEDGRVEILLPAGSLLRLGENSRLTLKDSTPQKSFSATLLLGSVWAKVHKLLSGETFHVETENGVAGVRGTEFRVEVAQGQDDLVRVYEGTVQVDARDGRWSHRIEAAHELRFHRERPPAGPRSFDPATERGRFMQWVRARKEQELRNPERDRRNLRHKQRERRERRRDR